MRLFFYYVSHTFINSIKKLFRTWVAVLIASMVLLGLFIGLGSAGMITFLEKNNVIEDSDEVYEEETEDLEEAEAPMDPEVKQMILQIFNLAITGFIFLAIIYHIYTADKGGTNIFLMPDVNLLFPAPKKPQSVLLFKILLQMGLLLAASLYLLFQLPNLILNFGLSLCSALLLCLSYILTLAFCKLVTIFTYTLTSTRPFLRTYTKPFAIGLLFLPVLLFLIVHRFSHKGLYETALLLFASKGFFAIPMLGWLTGLASSAFSQNHKMALLFFCLILAGLAFLIYLIWNMKADFYEDALTSAWKNTEKLEAAKKGMTMKKHHKKTKTMKDFTDTPLFGKGTKAFFDKILYNRKRFAKLGIFSNTALFYLVPPIVISILDAKIHLGGHSLTIIGCILAAFVFFRNFGNPLQTEFQTNYLFLVPESPYQKVFFSLFGCTCECFLDILPGMLIAWIALPDKIYIVCFWVLFIVSLDFMASATGFFVEMILPISINETIKGIFQLFLKILALLPLLISLIICVLLSQVGMTLLLSAVLNIVFAAVIICASAPFLHSGRS